MVAAGGNDNAKPNGVKACGKRYSGSPRQEFNSAMHLADQYHTTLPLNHG